MAERLAVIVRFHDLSRAFELRRALFSLVGQNYRPLTVCIVTQRFTESQLQNLRELAGGILALDPLVRLQVENFTAPEPADARSDLITLGMRKTDSRFIAFLDHDDTILPGSYQKLIADLGAGNAAVSFASVLSKQVEVFEDTLLSELRYQVFSGGGLKDLLEENFCPIHSFVLDRTRIDPAELWFDGSLGKAEDYEFLLRICSHYEASFRLLHVFSGEYYFKSDGSNTIGVPWLINSEKKADWERCQKRIEQRKKEIRLSEKAQWALGIESVDPHLTIHDYLRRYGPK